MHIFFVKRQLLSIIKINCKSVVEIAFLQAELKKHKQKAKFLGYLHLVPTKCMFLHIHKRR